MIIFELACGHGHRFEGWFASADDFAHQSNTRMVRCPVCDDAGVARVPSAKVRAGGGGSGTEAADAAIATPANSVADLGSSDLVGRAGLEPATNGLKVRCSTT